MSPFWVVLLLITAVYSQMVEPLVPPSQKVMKGPDQSDLRRSALKHLYGFDLEDKPQDLNDVDAFRHVIFDIELFYGHGSNMANKGCLALLEYLLLDEAAPARKAVRKVTVISGVQMPRNKHGTDDMSKDSLLADLGGMEELISKALLGFTNLKKVHWKGRKAIPKDILTLLEQSHPSCQLYYDHPYADEAVIGHSSLRSLRKKIEYEDRFNPKDLATTHKILTSCPNIKELDIALKLADCGDMNTESQPRYFDFETKTPARFPPLEVLRLQGYSLEGDPKADLSQEGEAYFHRRFKDENGKYQSSWKTEEPIRPDPWIPSGEEDNDNLTKDRTNLDDWKEVMDWSQLHTLELHRPTRRILRALGGDFLPVLKEISLRGGSVGHAIGYLDFIKKQSAPLESILFKNALFTSFGDVLNALEKGKTFNLKKFKLNEIEGLRGKFDWELSNNPPSEKPNPKAHQYFNATQIQKLQRLIPNVEELDLDIKRVPPPYNETGATITSWEEHFVDPGVIHTLSSFPHLKILRLRFEPEKYVKPYEPFERWGEWYDPPMSESTEDTRINKKTLTALYEDLRNANKEYGGVLERVEVFLGEWDDRDNYYNSIAHKFVYGHYTCTPEKGVQGWYGFHVHYSTRLKMQGETELEHFEYAWKRA